MRDLGTLGGTTAVAGLINESGQISGLSYTNTIPNETTGIPTLDSFFGNTGGWSILAIWEVPLAFHIG